MGLLVLLCMLYFGLLEEFTSSMRFFYSVREMFILMVDHNRCTLCQRVFSSDALLRGVLLGPTQINLSLSQGAINLVIVLSEQELLSLYDGLAQCF